MIKFYYHISIKQFFNFYETYLYSLLAFIIAVYATVSDCVALLTASMVDC